MSFLKGLQPTPKLGNFHFGKQTEISSRVNVPEADSANTKTESIAEGAELRLTVLNTTKPNQS